MAGLLWEKHCEKALFSFGFEKVKGWECLYVHQERQLFLSIYVDDFKMAGNKNNLKSMWKQLTTKLDLEEPVPLNGNVYLGPALPSGTATVARIINNYNTLRNYVYVSPTRRRP